MEKTIFVNGRIGKLDTPYFVFSDNKSLKLRFCLDNARNDDYYATFLCGNAVRVELLSEKKQVELPPAFFKQGNYEPIQINLELRSKKTGKVITAADAEDGFMIEPIYIEKTARDKKGIAWLQAMESKLNATLTRLTHVENELKKYKDSGVPLIAEKNYEN